MGYTLYMHFEKSEPLLLDVEELPGPQDNLITGRYPRRKDNKSVSYLDESVTTVIFATSTITFMEVMPSGQEEEIFKPFRE
jgi:hypothetical protein